MALDSFFDEALDESLSAADSSAPGADDSLEDFFDWALLQLSAPPLEPLDKG